MKLLHVASSRPVGEECLRRLDLVYTDWRLTDYPDACDVFVSVMYDKLLSEDFINGKAGRRCYNFHPGLLPEQRGSGAFSWAIINGDKQTGVTLHELDVSIDSGPIIAKDVFDVKPTDTARTLFETAMFRMVNMFTGWIRRLLRQEYVATPQDESKAKIYYRRDLQAARDLTRYARAFAFEGKPPAFYYNSKGEKVEIVW